MEREAEAMKEELGLGGWQPAAGQDIINSTTTTATTISTVGNGLFSMQYNGAQFLVSEEGESSYGSFALKNGRANNIVYDSIKTSPEHVTLDLELPAATAAANDLYLKDVYTKPENYNFYCPKCNACIEKVLIREEGDGVCCARCFDYVKLIGGWIFNVPPANPPLPPVDSPLLLANPPLSPANPPLPPVDSPLPLANPPLPPADPPLLPANPPLPPAINPPLPLENPSPPSPLLPPPQPKSPIKWEILKSVVYGGLIESITSLSIVTSAASSATATLNIVALALANLIGGLFVIGHNLRELKNDQYRVASNQEGEQVDRYEKILGQKKNFILHASVAILSFLVFGLVPPLVYGFSFHESDNEYLKLAVVAAASLLCITLLAIAKASIQSPPVSKYITTVLHYLAIGIGTSGICYLAGYMVEKLIEKLGLFESTTTVTLPLPGMSSGQHAWESY